MFSSFFFFDGFSFFLSVYPPGPHGVVSPLFGGFVFFSLNVFPTVCGYDAFRRFRFLFLIRVPDDVVTPHLLAAPLSVPPMARPLDSWPSRRIFPHVVIFIYKRCIRLYKIFHICLSLAAWRETGSSADGGGGFLQAAATGGHGDRSGAAVRPSRDGHAVGTPRRRSGRSPTRRLHLHRAGARGGWSHRESKSLQLTGRMLYGRVAPRFFSEGTAVVTWLEGGHLRSSTRRMLR